MDGGERAGDDAALVDQVVIEQLLDELEPDDVIEIVDAFLAEAGSRLGAVCAGSSEPDRLRGAQQASHALKGAAAIVGAKPLSEAAAALERRFVGDDADLPTAGELDQFAALAAATATALTEVRQRLAD